MTTATAPHLSPADLADHQAEDALYYRRVLHKWIDMGTEIGRAVHKQVVAQADEPAAMTDVRDAAVAFDRLSRAVRRSVVLARHVAEPVPARAEACRPERKRALARRRILREVEDAIGREAEGADMEVLEAELCERLDAPDLDDEIEGRPVAEVVADICRDLGLGTMLDNHPWKRRMPADVRDLCERAARPAGTTSAEPAPPAPEVGAGSGPGPGRRPTRGTPRSS